MTQIIENNVQFGKHLALWIGRMQRLGDSFQMLIVPVNHTANFQSIAPVLEALPSYLPPAQKGSVEYNAGFFALNRRYNVADAIAEIHAGNITFEARSAALNNIAELDETDTFEMNTSDCPFPIDRKAFARALGLPLECGPYRTYQLHFITDTIRGQQFLIITRIDQSLERVGLTAPLLSESERELFISNAEGQERQSYNIKIKGVENGRELLSHTDFQSILSYVSTDYPHIAEVWHGALRLQL